MNNNIIIIHCIAHILCAIWFYKKDKLSIRSFLWCFLSFFCIGGVILLSTNKYFDIMEYAHFTAKDRLNIIPYVMNFIFTFLMLQVWNGFKGTSINIRIKGLGVNNTKIMNTIIMIEIVYIVLKLYQLMSSVSLGLGMFHDLGADEINERLYGSFQPLIWINYLGRINNVILFPYVLTYRILGYKSGLFEINSFFYLLLLYGVGSILTGLVSGSRALMMFSILNVLFFIVVFYRFFPQKYKKIVIAIMAIFFLFIVNIFVIIGNERFAFGDRYDNILRYWGESYLNLGFEFYNCLSTHSCGEYSFREIMGVELSTIREMTHTNVWWFTTLYGSLFIDFGVFMPFLFPFVLFICIRLLYNKHKEITKIGNIAIILYLFKQSYLIPFNFHFSFLDVIFLVFMIVAPLFLDKYFVRNV